MDNIKDPENTIIMEIKGGTILIELLPDIAPLHCERMKTLVRSGLYDNVCFHSCLLYTSPSPRDSDSSRMPSSA